MQTIRVPFFLTTGTILANQSTYLAIMMKSHFNSLSISSLIFDWICGANLLGICFTGFLLGQIGNLSSTISRLNPGISL